MTIMRRTRLSIRCLRRRFSEGEMEIWEEEEGDVVYFATSAWRERERGMLVLGWS